MKTKTKVIVVSLLTIAMCVSLIAGGTFALFTSESTTNIAITSGKVDVAASVSSLWHASDITDEYAADSWIEVIGADMGDEGTVYTAEFATGGSVTYRAKTNAFTIDGIVPGDAVKFVLHIDNNSTVAVIYRINVSVNSDDGLGQWLSMKVNADGTSTEYSLGASIMLNAWTKLEPSATVDDSEVIIALPSSVTTEQAAGKTCNLSVNVVAMQGNADASSYCKQNGHSFEMQDGKEICPWCGLVNPVVGSVQGDKYVVDGLKDPNATDIEIPGDYNGVPVEIQPSAFKDNSKLQSVTLGEGITEIPKSAFEKCSGLTHVTLPSTVETIGESAFFLSPVEEVTIPSGTKTIGKLAFSRCQLTSIDIPASVTEIGDSAFAAASPSQYMPVTSLTLNEGLQTIGASAFSGLKFPELIIPDSVTRIGSGAFNDNSNLKKVIIGTGLKNTQSGIFNYCAVDCVIEYKEGATTVTNGIFASMYSLKVVTTKELYDPESGLQTVILPDTITTIDQQAFYNCINLTSVTLPQNLTTIKQWSFKDCSKLTSIIIPDSVKNIGTNKNDYSPFVGCKSLEWIVLPANLETFYGHANSSENSHFDKCGSVQVYFKGTSAEWAEKSFAANIESIADVTVFCTDEGALNYWDGDVSKLPVEP